MKRLIKREKTSKKKPEKSLTKKLKSKSGRGSGGRITVRRRGAGARRRYRMVEFGQPMIGIKGKVLAVEYDPYRTSNIILVEYEGGKKEYRIAYYQAKEGDEIIIDEQTPVKPGNRMKLKNIPIGTKVYNIELTPQSKGKIIRAAGASADVMGLEGVYAMVKMPSKELRRIHSECYATIGRVSNPEHRFEKIGKAGTARHMGRRPKVRGTAMAAGPHPHGGGEGKTSIGLKYPKTPWGKIAHGGKTRRRKNTDKYIIKNRKQAKR